MRTLPPPKALLVDLDDTLIDLGASSLTCWEELAGQFAAQAGVDAPAFLAAIHQARQWFWSDPDRHRTWRVQMDSAREEIIKLALRQLNVHAPQLPSLFARNYDVMLFERIRLFPQAIESLQAWRVAGLRLALVTNGAGPAQRRKISQFKLADHFDCIVIEGEFGVGKPEERVYRHALAQLGVEAADTWMIGDRLDWEVAMPQSLGMRGIWVDLAGKGVPPESAVRPDFIVRAVSEVAALINMSPA